MVTSKLSLLLSTTASSEDKSIANLRSGGTSGDTRKKADDTLGSKAGVRNSDNGSVSS